eukprot:2190058-Pyramimonas_sp.AAC.1
MSREAAIFSSGRTIYGESWPRECRIISLPQAMTLGARVSLFTSERCLGSTDPLCVVWGFGFWER